MNRFSFKKTILTAAIACSVIATPCHAFFSFGGAAGSSEVTQLLNYVQLLANAKQTLDQYRLMFKQVQGLSPAKLLEVLGPEAERYNSSLALYESLGRMQRTAETFQNQTERQIAEAQALSKDGTEYFQLRKRIAESKGGIYREQYKTELAVVEQAKSDGEDLGRQLDNAKSLTTQMEGLQSLAASNAKMVASIKQLSASVAQANMTAYAEKSEQEKEKAALLALQQKDAENRIKANTEYSKFQPKIAVPF